MARMIVNEKGEMVWGGIPDGPEGDREAAEHIHSLEAAAAMNPATKNNKYKVVAGYETKEQRRLRHAMRERQEAVEEAERGHE